MTLVLTPEAMDIIKNSNNLIYDLVSELVKNGKIKNIPTYYNGRKAQADNYGYTAMAGRYTGTSDMPKNTLVAIVTVTNILGSEQDVYLLFNASISLIDGKYISVENPI